MRLLSMIVIPHLMQLACCLYKPQLAVLLCCHPGPLWPKQSCKAVGGNHRKRIICADLGNRPETMHAHLDMLFQLAKPDGQEEIPHPCFTDIPQHRFCFMDLSQLPKVTLRPLRIA